jgi:ribonuclease P/MRP protein subunit RPP40
MNSDSIGKDRDRGNVSYRQDCQVAKKKLFTHAGSSNEKILKICVKNRLKVLCCNARSVRNKMDELKTIVKLEGIDIIGITESWANKNDTALLCIDGFTLFRQDRISRKGGGVLIYIRDCLSCKEFNVSSNLNNIETVWVEIYDHQGRKLIVGNVYRPPNVCREQDELLCKLIKEACQAKEVILMGDFNLPGINWENLESSDEDSLFVNTFQDCFLQQMVQEGTREGAILDLVLSNNEDRLINIAVGEHLGDSDHSIIRAEVQCSLGSSNAISANNVEEQWVSFKRVLNQAVNKFVPFVKKRVARKLLPMWFSSEVKNALREKQKAFKQLKQTGDEEDRQIYKICRRKFKYVSRKRKKEIEEKLAKDINKKPKDFFAYANGNKKVSAQLGPIEDSEGNMVYDNEGMANILNDFFVSVFNDSFKEGVLTDSNSISCMQEFEFSRDEIVYHLKRIKPFKAPGPDDIYPRVLVECAEEIGDMLNSIFNSSLKTGLVPTDWKLANITPLFKKGSKSAPGNYRPVSLTSVIGKLFETLLKIKIMGFLDSKDLLSNIQYGFRKGRSCTTNLLSFYDNVTKELDIGNAVDITYIDFQKAFDKVPHQALLLKLNNIGLNNQVVRWVDNWLKGRMQRVQIKGTYSQWAEVKSGVPQGSVLGPILFIIFINDISLDVSGEVSCFADDLKIMGIVNTEEQIKKFQFDLDKISDWAHKWGMSFNINKCQVLHMGNKNKNFTYKLQGVDVVNAIDVGDLGVLVTKEFKMGTQCAAASNKANRMLGYLKRSICSRSKEVILPLYKSLVRPHLEYAVQFWSPYFKKDIDVIERVQHRATKIIQGTSGMDYVSRLKKLNMYTLQDRRDRGDMIQLFKLVKEGKAEGFHFVNEGRTRGNGMKLYKPLVRQERRKHYFFNRVIDKWNKLPADVVNATNVKTFKDKLDRHWAIIS